RAARRGGRRRACGQRGANDGQAGGSPGGGARGNLEGHPFGSPASAPRPRFLTTPRRRPPKRRKGASRGRKGGSGTGTGTDYDTGLVWEQKTDDGSVHDKDNMYILTIEIAGIPPNGTAFTDFLGTLNNCVDDGTDPPTGVIGGFAGHCDWRLPSIVELE